MVLRAALLDLDRAHQRAQTAGARPVPSVGNAVKQSGPVGVAAARRIEDRARLHDRDFVALAFAIDHRALRAEGEHQRLHVSRHGLEAHAGFLFEQLALVVVDRDVVGQPDELGKFAGREHRQPLAGIEHERDACLGALARVLQHAVLAIGRDDRELRAERRVDAVLVREVHRAGVERDDLVVVEVGGDERLRSELPGDLAQMLRRQALRIESFEVRGDVLADRGHDHRVAAEQPEVVADIGGATAVLAPHLRCQEANIEDVELVCEQVILESVREHHDRVVGDRARDESTQKSLSSYLPPGSWQREG